MTSRPRSNSMGRQTDGVNPYQKQAASARHEEMIVMGRGLFLERLEATLKCKARFVQTVASGNTELDEFHIARDQVQQRNQVDVLKDLQALSPRVTTTNGNWFVYVDLAQYDRRVMGLDFTWMQWAIFGALLVVVFCMLFIAIDNHNYATGKSNTLAFADWLETSLPD